MSITQSTSSSLVDEARQAFSRLQSECPEDAAIVGKYLGALHNKNVIALADGEAFTLLDAEGRNIKATKRTVRLSTENGGLVQPVWKGPYVISAPGYSMLAHAAGAVVMNAPTVTVDGVAQQNPHVRRGPDGSIVEVHCRAMAFRYNENGQPMVSDRTTIFDTATYALADMVGKAKRQNDAFKLLPATMPAPDPKEEWACYRIDEAVSLWMHITHDEVISFLGQVLNRKKKALEFAQTFAQRNALKHLFGLAVVPGQADSPLSVWDVPVVCWQPSDGGFVRFDTARYAESAKIIDALSEGRPVSLPQSQEPVVISRGTEEINGADMDGESDPLENPDIYESGAQMKEAEIEARPTQESSDEPEPEQDPLEEAPTPQEEKDWKNLQVAMTEFDVEYAQALKNLGLQPDGANPRNAVKILHELNRILDGGAL